MYQSIGSWKYSIDTHHFQSRWSCRC